jgi:hypothetical protein
MKVITIPILDAYDDSTMKKSATNTLLIIMLIIFARLTPHLANFSPCITFAVFSSIICSRRRAYLAVFLGLFLSDMLLYTLYSPFYLGWWILFTYSGLLIVTALGYWFARHKGVVQTVGIVMSANIVYWLWTNGETWLFSHLYLPNLQGLLACYTLALPFLARSLAANLVFSLLLFSLLKAMKTKHTSDDLALERHNPQKTPG